ncbi:unnamed protein product, partial [Prorocentrum cordatum]
EPKTIEALSLLALLLSAERPPQPSWHNYISVARRGLHCLARALRSDGPRPRPRPVRLGLCRRCPAGPGQHTAQPDHLQRLRGEQAPQRLHRQQQGKAHRGAPEVQGVQGDRPRAGGQRESAGFKLGGLSVGTFHVGNLPFAPTNLLLVPYRKGNGTMAATFYSHSFAVVHDHSEIAVVDAYDGSDRHALRIGQAGKRQTEAADLKANTVVSLTPGAYRVSMGDGSKSAQTVALAAAEGSNHVVMRVGGDDGLPAELVAFTTGQTTERSGAPRASGALLVAAAAACAALFA